MRAGPLHAILSPVRWSNMKIWLPPENDGGARITAGVIAIVALAMALTVGGTLLVMITGLPVLETTFLLMLLVCALVLALAMRLRSRARRASLIFCLDTARRLYYIDVADLVPYRRGPAGFAAMNAEIKRTVASLAAPGGELERRICEPDGLSGFANEILSVRSIRETPRRCAVNCEIRHRNMHTFRRTLTVVRGLDNEAALLYELERLCRPAD